MYVLCMYIHNGNWLLSKICIVNKHFPRKSSEQKKGKIKATTITRRIIQQYQQQQQQQQ